MGGIKNKLSKLSDKAKILLSSLSLKGAVSRRLTEGSPKSGSRLPSFSQPSKMPDGQISNTRKFNYWGLYASKPIGSLRPITFTKYLGIACLSLAIVSTLILNVISSYSNSNIESNAEPASTALSSDASILANSSFLSISFSNATGSCTDTSNPANVCMEIPDGGGIATGGHTVTVNAPSDSDYRLTLSSANNETDLANGSNRIASISNPASISTLNDLADKTWGMSIAASGSVATSSIYGLQSIDNPLVLIDTQSGDGVVSTGPAIDIQYGAKVADPSLMPAGDYSVSVVYTATAIVPPAMLTNLVLNDTLLTGQQKEFAVQGTNLATANRVTLCNADNPYLCYVTDDVQTYANTAEAGTIISFVSPEIDVVGVYDIIVRTDGGEARLDDSFRVVEQSICMNGVNANSDCQVDIDDNMIPIRYIGNNPDGSAIWVTVSDNEIDHNPGLWYDYGKKQWANAVTVASGSLSKYKNKSNVVIDENDVLGYWVYIPRYAYEVQRRDVTDHYVVDGYPLPDNTTTGVNTSMNSHALKNDFIIQFEKSDTLKKTPAASCNAWRKSAQDMWVGGVKPTDNSDQAGKVLAVDYRTGCDISREYGSSVNTTWGTHPAFSFGNTQLNGVWVGKFETTGYTSDEPTVKPNLHAFLGGNEDGYRVAGLYDVAKSIGVYDSLNSGGGGRIPISQNYHRLASATSHMTKSSEWGAALYLAMSYYGAGVNEIQSNTAEGNRYELDPLDEYISNGVTGCGPSNNGDFTSYSTDESHVGDSVLCGSAERSYSGSIGVLSSTTNNAYGIYGMSGGADDFVAGSLTSSNNAIVDPKGQFSVLVQEPYTDLYKEKDGFGAAIPGWSIGGSFQTANADVCTWETCGGKAIHEVSRLQSAMIVNYIPPTNGWGNAMLYFRGLGYWFTRGGSYSDAEDDSKWYDTSNILLSMTSRTDIYYANGFRTSLLVKP